jgi:glycosyltransferase involved in cell wall biosynthesis
VAASVLVIIPYDISIGFAFGRLIGIFYEACVRARVPAAKIHYAFTAVGDDRCRFLPEGFANLVAFDARAADAQQLEHLCRYVREHGIRGVLAVDTQVHARHLGPLRHAGVQRIVSYWGAPLSSINSGVRLWLKRLEVALLRPNQPDHHIVESRAMLRSATHGRGVPPNRVTVIPNGVDTRAFRPMPEARHIAHQRFGIAAERAIVVYMGHVHLRKGVHVLLQAIDRIVRDHGRTDVHVLVLGDRPGEAQALQSYYDPAQGGRCITFGGYHSDVPTLLAGCYLGCVPTTGWDSFPFSPLEMQACGVPAVVSDCQGIPETVADGVTGAVVKAGDADALARTLLRLRDDPALRARMSEAAVERIRSSYDREQQIDAMARTMRRVGIGVE